MIANLLLLVTGLCIGWLIRDTVVRHDRWVKLAKELKLEVRVKGYLVGEIVLYIVIAIAAFITLSLSEM